MKKLLVFSLFAVVLTLSLVGCKKNESLYLLIWDEYIDESLIEDFEVENNCQVVVEIAESNELMYSSITRDAAPYDIAIPSDYMIDQLQQEGLLKKIEFDKLTNYSKAMFDPTLNTLIDKYAPVTKDYFVTYFWGSLGILYNTDLIDEEHVKDLETRGWEVLFDPEFSNKMCMYASSRDSIACALLALGKSLNTKDKADLLAAEELLKKVKYEAWATDDLKVGIASGKYSATLGYTGDYFDIVYSSLEENKDMHFDFFCPKDANNVFYDSMVIPATSQNTDLAHKFIDFMIDHENALTNAQYVGYCPTITSVYEAMVADPEYQEVTTLDAYYPGDILNGEIYQYLGNDIYQLYEDIYKRVKGKK